MEENNLILASQTPVISPHPLAPLYDFPGIISEYERHLAQQRLLQEAVTVVTSETGWQATEENRQLLRQSGFVNMFFALRFIAGYANAFTRLTPSLHLDIANFYQLMRRFPGTKMDVFLFRGG